MRRKLKWVALVIYSSFIVSILSTAAAGSSASVESVHSSGGYDYRDYNRTVAGLISAEGDTFTGPQLGSKAIPGGYAGAKAVIYNSSGTKVKEATWVYNSSSVAVGNFLMSVTEYYTAGTYLTQGIVRAYTTDLNAVYYPYYQYGTFATGYQTL